MADQLFAWVPDFWNILPQEEDISQEEALIIASQNLMKEKGATEQELSTMDVSYSFCWFPSTTYQTRNQRSWKIAFYQPGHIQEEKPPTYYVTIASDKGTVLYLTGPEE